jgi:hypothetical protein
MSHDKTSPDTSGETTSLPSRRRFLSVGGLTAVGIVACAGKDGINGLDGAQGTQGTQGPQGAQGDPGAQGAQGAQGNPGQNCTNAPNGLNAIPTSWDFEADVVVIGSGAAGMVAALAAKDKGASVIVVEANYDVGGHAIVSGGTVDLGGGTAPQVALGIADSPDNVYDDLCEPASYIPDPKGSLGATYASADQGLVPGLNWGRYGGPFQDRAFCRTYADNNVATEKFLRDNGIVWASTITTSHWDSKSHTARSHVPTWANNVPGYASPNGAGGAGYIRPLEITARNKGIKFLLNYRVNGIHRDAVFSGSVRGVTAGYTPKIANGVKLQPYCTQSSSLVPNVGNLIDPAGSNSPATLNIKANKGVFVATGGATSNVFLRRMFDMRMAECYSVGGDPYSEQTGDGILLSQKCGASLFAPGNQVAGASQLGGGSQYNKPGQIGCFYGYQNLQWKPASPVFPLAGGSGLRASGSYGDVIHVNQVGQRFADENAPQFTWCDAAMCANAGSAYPDFSAGPVWAIFDEPARVRRAWDVTTAGSIDPNFFYSADTIQNLVKKINTNKFQVTPMDYTVLQATITKYNGFVTAGVDSDFGKAASLLTNKIETGPFYAAFSPPVLHDWLTGIRIDEGAHVLDLDGKVIPGLYAGGEDVGGMVMHGLAKCAVYGMIGGHNAADGV